MGLAQPGLRQTALSGLMTPFRQLPVTTGGTMTNSAKRFDVQKAALGPALPYPRDSRLRAGYPRERAAQVHAVLTPSWRRYWPVCSRLSTASLTPFAPPQGALSEKQGLQDPQTRTGHLGPWTKRRIHDLLYAQVLVSSSWRGDRNLNAFRDLRMDRRDAALGSARHFGD
jgi:hypothetical protein